MDPIIGTTDQHVYHHTDPRPATVNVTVTRNTKGIGWEVTVNGATEPIHAVALAEEAITELRRLYGAEEVAG